MNEHKVGDTVKLASGGPRMTVTDFHEDGDVVCQWFDGNNIKQGVFKPATLRPAHVGVRTGETPES